MHAGWFGRELHRSTVELLDEVINFLLCPDFVRLKLLY